MLLLLNLLLLLKTFPKHEKKISQIIISRCEEMLDKQKKLKMLKVEFIKKKITFYDFELFEILEIKFINQPIMEDDSIKIENLIKRFEWTWEIKSFVAAALVSLILITFLYLQLYDLYCERLPTLALRDNKFDVLINYTFYSTWVETIFFIFPTLITVNLWLVETLTQYCAEFALLF